MRVQNQKDRKQSPLERDEEREGWRNEERERDGESSGAIAIVAFQCPPPPCVCVCVCVSVQFNWQIDTNEQLVALPFLLSPRTLSLLLSLYRSISLSFPPSLSLSIPLSSHQVHVKTFSV